MEGYCKGENPDKTLHREGDFEGNYYSGGATVSFRVKLVKVFTPHPGGKWTATLTFEGHGPVTGNTASGVANFDLSCVAEGELVYCINDSTTLQLNGTMPYQIDFIP